ncbi:hypothetical protein PG989_010940 [Apiospora arundinis]
MTVVLNPGGQTQEWQVGLQDVPAAISIVSSLVQWSGTLNGIRRFIKLVPNLIKTNTIKELGFIPGNFKASYGILTPQGIVYEQPLKPECFGDDDRLKFVGFTICAIAHVFDGDVAVRFFMRCLAPTLLGDYAKHGIKEAFHAELTDNCKGILSEGAAHGLTASFEESIRRFDTLAAPAGLSRKHDAGYVEGLLRWLATANRRRNYLTRSATVVRVAACLKVVGWNIGNIQTWADPERPPVNCGAIVLVISGTTETDSMATDPNDVEFDADKELFRTHHYQKKTVGSALYNALGGPSKILPEEIQSHFDEISNYITSHLQFSWTVIPREEDGVGPKLLAVPVWKMDKYNPNKSSVKLASAAFTGQTIENVASCFDFISDTAKVVSILEYQKAVSRGNKVDMPESMKWFNIVVISILMSVAELLGGPKYTEMMHATQLDLAGPTDFEERSAFDRLRTLRWGLDSGYANSNVIELLSIFHGGMPFHSLFMDQNLEDYSRIGFQNRGYNVLPSLLYNMKVDEGALGYRCGTTFLANIPSADDGRVESSRSDCWSYDIVGAPPNDAVDTLVLQNLDRFIGPPTPQPADASIYLNFERPYHYAPSGSNIVLAGRIGGEVIGFSGIIDVMTTLASSFSARPPRCPGHARGVQAFNVKAATWMANRNRRPKDSSSSHHTYIPVQKDDAWALFLAGQITQVDGRISFGCYDCLLAKDNRLQISTEDDYPRVYVGFH